MDEGDCPLALRPPRAPRVAHGRSPGTTWAAILRRMAAPALIFFAACQSLDPTVAYREAARNLKFSLDRVEPRLELAFPLDRSRLRLRLHLGVQNNSPTRLLAKALGGNLSMKMGAQAHAIGLVSFPSGLDLAPSGRSEAVAELAFDYQAIKAAWGPLSEVLQHNKAATWHLEGEAKLEVLGFPISIPLRATSQSGKPSDHPPIAPSPGRHSRSPRLAEGAPPSDHPPIAPSPGRHSRSPRLAEGAP